MSPRPTSEYQALLFVPSESIYAELYDGFDDLFQRAQSDETSTVTGQVTYVAPGEAPVTIDGVRISVRGHTSKLRIMAQS